MRYTRRYPLAIVRRALQQTTICTAIFFISSCDQNKSTTSSEAKSETMTANTETLPAQPPANFKHAVATTNGIKIHYVIGGKGEPLLLLHGFAENWYVWNRLLPELSKNFTVIAPDLPGVGESDKPQSGYEKKKMAQDMHEFMQQLGYNQVYIVGHDVGLMVAYDYAAQYRNEVKKLVLMDALLPGVEPVWSQTAATTWHFKFFNRPVAASMIHGHEKEFFPDFWSQLYGTNKAPFYKEEIDEFVRAYSTPGSDTGSLNWYKAFSQDAIDNRELTKQKLQIPVLTMGGEFSAASFIEDHIKLVATNVKGVEVKGAGHWLVQEQTEQVLKALQAFLNKK